MNALKNKVQLIGNLGDKPEIFTFENGNKKAKLSLATNETYKNKAGEKVDETTWHNVVAYGKIVEVIEKYLEKGSEIALEGKLTNRSFETKEGEKRYITEVVLNDLLMMGKREKKNW